MTDAPIRCANNGYGRIGRSILRALYEYRQWPIQIVAINDLADPEPNVHLIRFDFTQNRFHGILDFCSLSLASIDLTMTPILVSLTVPRPA